VDQESAPEIGNLCNFAHLTQMDTGEAPLTALGRSAESRAATHV